MGTHSNGSRIENCVSATVSACGAAGPADDVFTYSAFHAGIGGFNAVISACEASIRSEGKGADQAEVGSTITCSAKHCMRDLLERLELSMNRRMLEPMQAVGTMSWVQASSKQQGV